MTAPGPAAAPAVRRRPDRRGDDGDGGTQAPARPARADGRHHAARPAGPARPGPGRERQAGRRAAAATPRPPAERPASPGAAATGPAAAAPPAAPDQSSGGTISPGGVGTAGSSGPAETLTGAVRQRRSGPSASRAAVWLSLAVGLALARVRRRNQRRAASRDDGACEEARAGPGPPWSARGSASALAAAARADGAFPNSQNIMTPAAPPPDRAGTNFGLVISSDNGRSWTWSCEQPLNAFATLYQFGPSPANRLFAVSHQGVIASDDLGCSWSAASGLAAGVAPLDVFADPTDASRVLRSRRPPRIPPRSRRSGVRRTGGGVRQPSSTRLPRAIT